MLILTFTVLSAMALEGALMVRARAGLVQTWAKTHVVGLHTADPP